MFMFNSGEHLEAMGTTVAWASKASEFHADRWEYLHGRMHAAGYALDPEFLYNGDGGALDQATMEGVMEVIERLSLRSVIQSATDPDLAATALTLESEQVQEHAAKCMLQFSSFRAMEGPLTKPFVMRNAQSMPPSAWWIMFGTHLPELQAVACTVLKQPVSASACERNWSIYGQLKTPARNRMQHAVADKRVYCHEALHYQAKLQNAEYQMQVADWSVSDSDEDTDAEDDISAVKELLT